jgi:hypothetical protein
MPGDGINGIIEALRTRQDQVRFIQVRHEEAAAFNACAYAKWLAGSVSAWPPPVLAAFTFSMASTMPSSTANPHFHDLHFDPAGCRAGQAVRRCLRL